MTDAEGKFAFDGLDPELLFQLLVVARGHAPLFTERDVDPRLGEVTVELEPRDLESQPPERVLRGRVVDAKGDPIRNARIEPQGQRLARGMRFGGIEADALAISDEEGEFALGVGEPGMVVLLLVSARAHAPRMSPWLTAGAEENVVTLTRGATVTGRVERDGKPVAGLTMGLVQQDRNAERYLGEDLIDTDASGRFTFVNVGPDDVYSLYGKAESGSRLGGAIPVRVVRVGADETTLDVGILPFEPGLRLSGRVVMSDGSALIEGTRLILDREEAFDAMVTTVAADGSFAFTGVPRELLALSAPLRTYRVSPENASYDFVNRSGLLGRLEEDTELVLLLEPGPTSLEPPDLDAVENVWARYEELRRSPMRGWPGKRAEPGGRQQHRF